MKVNFIVFLDFEKKAGLFYSAHSRIIEAFKDKKNQVKVHNLNFYDGKLIRWFKALNNIPIFHKENDKVLDGIVYNSINIKVGVFYYLLVKLGLDFYFFLFTSHKIKYKFNKDELIVAHWGPVSGFLAYWLKKIKGVTAVCVYHGSDIHTLPFENKSYKNNISKVLKFLDGNIFVSNDLLKIAKGFSVVKNPIVIYNGVYERNLDQEKSHSNFKFQNQTPFKKNVVGYVGNLEHVKGVDFLPKIFQQLNRLFGGEVSFVVVGDGILKNLLREEFDKNSLDVYMTGYIGHDDLWKIYSVLNILILPSRKEGFGMVLWEALKYNVKCYGSRVGGIPEAIGIDNTVVLDTNFVENITDLIFTDELNNQYKKGKVIYWTDIYNREKEFFGSISKK